MKQKLNRDMPLAEVVTKGSLTYTVDQVIAAFRAAYPYPAANSNLETFHVGEVFVDYLIVFASNAPGDEYYKVPYTVDADGTIQIAPREQWIEVELTYKPRTERQGEVDENKSTRRKRFIERVGTVELEEKIDGGPRRIRVARAITADIVNANRRRYPAAVLAAAVAELRKHLHESAGQGRLLQILGETEHPSDKGNRGPRLLETVVVWDEVGFDGKHVSLRGRILETNRGRDLIALMEGGVRPGVSLRGYGESKIEGDERIEEVTKLHITGFDIVSEPGFVDALAVLESKDKREVAMTLDQLKELLAAHPEVFKDLFEGKLEELSAEALNRLEEALRAKLGIGADADLGKALAEAVAAQKKLAEQERRAQVQAAIIEATKDLPYGTRLNVTFRESIAALNPQTVDDVHRLVETKRKEYDRIVADARLDAMGFNLRVVGPVIEGELGIPEFARGAHQFTEALVQRGYAQTFDLRKPLNRSQLFATQVLARFDECYKRVPNGGGLIAEAQLFQEAERTSDLNLPYSASRAIIAAATAQLVAPSVFDFGTVDTNPTRVYYEQYAHDTTVVKTVSMGDAFTLTALNVWVDIAHKRIIPGTLVCKNHAETTTYVEGTDYVIDYGNGRFMALSGGAIGETDNIHLGYQYMAIRKGEMGVIERGMGQLSYVTLDCVADRLAQQVSQEAIVFSRSQIGWDAVSRTMAMLIEQIRRKIDKDVFYLALASALSVPANIGGTWTAASDPLDKLVSHIGVAKVKVASRYTPEAVVLSMTRSNDLSNWVGFTAAGKFPSADLKENGYVGRIKGLPVFETTEFSDAYVLVTNREQVMHRVFQPLVIKGPFPSYDQATAQLIAADEYYAEEINGSVSPIPGKASVVRIA